MEANENYKEINVEDSRKDPASLFYYYKKLIALRKEHDVLIYGNFRLLEEEHPQVFAYERSLDGRKVVVVCNFGETPAQMNATQDLTDGKVLIHNYEGEAVGKEIWTLKPYEAWMIEI